MAELETFILHRGQQLTPEQKERLDAFTEEQLARGTRLYDRLNAKIRKSA